MADERRIESIRQKFDARAHRAQFLRRERALLGKPTGAGYVFDVPGKPNHVYVRIEGGDGGLTLSDALYVPRGRLVPDLRVWVDLDADGITRRIVTVQPDAAYEAGAAAATLSVPDYVHQATGAAGVAAGRVQRYAPGGAASMTVSVAAFWYSVGGDVAYFPGGTLNLAGDVPGSANTHAWTMVGLDPATNSLVSVAGDAQPVTAALSLSELAAIDFGGYVPLAGVALQYGQTTLSASTRIVDIRPLAWDGPGVGGVSDLDDLSDVDTSGANDGDVLAYDSGTSSWRPVTPGSSGGVPVGLRLSRANTRQIIDSEAWTKLVWDTEDYNPNGIVWSGGDITVPETGIYVIYLNLQLYSVYNNYGRKVVNIGASLDGLNAWAEFDPSVSGEYYVALTPMGPLTKDEIVRTYVWHDSGYDDMEVEGSIALNRIA